MDSTSPPASPITLLCVDDDATVLSALRTLLKNTLGTHCQIELAESGQEALEICEELQAEGQAVNVVISDFIMPSMRGDELLVRLHEKFPDMVKIMLTGQSDFAGVKRVINEARLYRFIEKPFNNADLVLTAKAAIEAKRSEAQMQAEISELKRRVAELEQALAVR
ncbi:response regulator [Curvibacter gracilis]|uniref:response regulator n=1 Tax=Curvibacter gracilis TaxID=230310 RepID=UPI0004B3B3B8|nr:response regulator [Curvibacter gracilis]